MLHVITRTSNRPNFFKLCRNTVKNQTYIPINHIVISDNDKDTYISEYEGIQLIKLNSKNYSHFELYLNEALQIIPEDDYFCVLDDDDFYTTEKSLEIAMKAIGTKDVVI